MPGVDDRPPTRRLTPFGWVNVLVLGAVSGMFLWPFLPKLGFADDRSIETAAGRIKVETVAAGLDHPWGMAFLPDGRLLVTERPGRLRLVADGKLSEPLSGVPEVYARGQGGLLDVAIDPDFKSNRLVYLSYAEPGKGGASTAVARGKLSDRGSKTSRSSSASSRRSTAAIISAPVSLSPRRHAVHHAWRALHIHAGPGSLQRSRQDRAHQSRRVGAEGQSLCRPRRGTPRNLVLRSSQRPRRRHPSEDRQAVGERVRSAWRRRAQHSPSRCQLRLAGGELGRQLRWQQDPGSADPSRIRRSVCHWTPVISPSGITFYTGDAIPGWKDNLLIAGLSSEAIIRLTLDGEKVSTERIPMGARIRDVVEAPDGSVYAVTDDERQDPPPHARKFAQLTRKH